MIVTGPAAQDAVDPPQARLHTAPERPVVEFLANKLPQVLLALGVGFDVRVIPPASSWSPAQCEAQELEAFVTEVHYPALGLVEGQSLGLEPAVEPLAQWVACPGLLRMTKSSA